LQPTTQITSRISVQIVTYNHAETIAACLEPLLAQRADFPELHICIVDNASQDETVAEVQRFSDLHNAGIEIIASPTNTGYAGGHNLALKHTSSDFVLTLNPDVRLRPGYLKAMLNTMQAHPEVGACAGRLLRIESLSDTEPYAIDGIGIFMRRNRRQGLLLDGAPVDAAPDTPLSIFGPDGAAAFYRRAMLDDIAIDGEIFDEDFFIHKEDVDLCWRALLRGWTSLYVPDAAAEHVRTFRPGRRDRANPFLRMCAVRNRYLLMLKNEIPALFWRDFLSIAAYDAAIIGYLLLQERESLSALRSAWKLRKHMMEKRRVIQSRRRIDAAAMAKYFRGEKRVLESK
jgi:GT2 family glycosyltransferase